MHRDNKDLKKLRSSASKPATSSLARPSTRMKSGTGKNKAGVVCPPSHDVCGEDDQIASYMRAEQAKSEKAGNIRAAGDHAQQGREQPDTMGSISLRC
jgi:hypothetical protein